MVFIAMMSNNLSAQTTVNESLSGALDPDFSASELNWGTNPIIGPLSAAAQTVSFVALNTILYNSIQIEYPSGYAPCSSQNLGCYTSQNSYFGRMLRANHPLPYFPEGDARNSQMNIDFLGTTYSFDFSDGKEDCQLLTGSILGPIGALISISANICVSQTGDKACAEMLSLFGLSVPLGCYYIAPIYSLSESGCFDKNGNIISTNYICQNLGGACKNGVSWNKSLSSGNSGHPFAGCVSNSPTPIPQCFGTGPDSGPYYFGESEITGNFIMGDGHLTGPVVACITETISKVFNLGENNGSSIFNNVKALLKSFVVGVLTLYVVLYGYKIMLSNQMVQKGDIFLHIMKFAIVYYFAAAGGINDFFPGIIKFADFVASYVYDASINSNLNGVCNQIDMVQKGYVSDPEHISLWDTLDCRLLTYTGFTQFGYGSFISVAFAILTSVLYLKFFAGLMFVLMFITALFLVSVIIQITHVFILNAISLVVLLFVGPLLIVSVLFEKTKNIFRSWLNAAIAMMVFPIILFIYIAFLMASLDRFMYGDTVTLPNGMVDTNNCDKSSIMCIIGIWSTEGVIIDIPFLFDISLPFLDVVELYDSFSLAMLQFTLVIYLFYQFNKVIYDIAQEIVGSSVRAGKGFNLFDKALDLAITFISVKTKGVGGKVANKLK